MMTDPASLDRLRDIATPDPIPIWPPAVGWWVLLAIVTTVLLLTTWNWIQIWHRRSYRREAVRHMKRATTAKEISETLKRTALVAFPREETASLSGEAWYSWLVETSMSAPDSQLQEEFRLLASSRPAQHPSPKLLEFSLAWIKKHRGNVVK